MPQKRLLILGVLCAAAMAAALLTQPHTGMRVTDETGTPLFPELTRQAEQIARLKITQGDSTISIEKDANNIWRVREKKGYPADVTKVRAALHALADTVLLEKRTAKPEHYQSLGLDKKFARRVTVYAQDANKPLADLWVGLLKGTRQASFVRMDGSEQTWLARGDLTFDPSARGWIENPLLSVPESEIHRVVIEQKEGDPIEIIRRKPGGEVSFASMPPHAELGDPQFVTSILTSLTNLEAEDVLPRAELRNSSARATRIFTFDGRELELRFNAEGSSTPWVTLEASYDPARAVKGVTLIDAPKDPSVWVESLHQKTSKFAFQISTFQQEALQSNWSRLLKK